MTLLDEVTDVLRTWLRNNGYRNLAENADETKVFRSFHCLYSSGFPGFMEIHGGTQDDRSVIWLLMVRRFGLDFANRIFWCS